MTLGPLEITTAQSSKARSDTIEPIILPTDILLCIIQQTERDELKQWRSTCKLFCHLVTPMIFSSIMISPYADSIERAKKVAGTGHLAIHVNSIVQHICGFSGHYQRFQDFEAEILRLDGTQGSLQPSQPSQDNTVIQQKHQAYVRQMENHRLWLQSDKLKDLQHICSKLVNLKSVTVQDDSTDTTRDNYYSKRIDLPCGEAVWHGANDLDHVQNLFLAMQENSIETISLDGIDRDHLRSLRHFCAKDPQRAEHIKCFTIRLIKWRVHVMPGAGVRDGCFLAAFLRLAQNLQHLELSSGRHLDPGYRMLTRRVGSHRQRMYESRMFTRPLLNLCWPKLMKLSIQGATVNKVQFRQFLQRHSASLRDVHLKKVSYHMYTDHSTRITAEVMASMMNDINGNIHLNKLTVDDVQVRL